MPRLTPKYGPENLCSAWMPGKKRACRAKPLRGMRRCWKHSTATRFLKGKKLGPGSQVIGPMRAAVLSKQALYKAMGLRWPGGAIYHTTGPKRAKRDRAIARLASGMAGEIKRIDKALAGKVEPGEAVTPEKFAALDDADALRVVSRAYLENAYEVALAHKKLPAGEDLKRDRLMIEAATGFVRVSVKVDEARYRAQVDQNLSDVLAALVKAREEVETE